MAETPEQKAQREIDADLTAVGWTFRDKDDLDDGRCGVTVREFAMKPRLGFARRRASLSRHCPRPRGVVATRNTGDCGIDVIDPGNNQAAADDHTAWPRVLLLRLLGQFVTSEEFIRADDKKEWQGTSRSTVRGRTAPTGGTLLNLTDSSCRTNWRHAAEPHRFVLRRLGLGQRTTAL
jgi:hypothetical protein